MASVLALLWSSPKSIRTLGVSRPSKARTLDIEKGPLYYKTNQQKRQKGETVQ